MRTRMLPVLLSIVATFLSACATITKRPLVKRVARLQTESRNAFARGDNQAALAMCNELERIAPGNPSVLYDLACANARLGQTAEAMEILQEATEAGYLAWEHAEADPDWEGLRDDPAMPGIIARMKANLDEWLEAGKDPYAAVPGEPCPTASSVRAITAYYARKCRQFWSYGRVLGPRAKFGTEWGYLRGEIDALRAYLAANPDAKDAPIAYLRMVNTLPQMHRQSCIGEPTLNRMKAIVAEFQAKCPESELLPEAQYRLLGAEFQATILRLNQANARDPQLWKDAWDTLGAKAVALADTTPGTKTEGLALCLALKLHWAEENPDERTQAVNRLRAAMKRHGEVRDLAWREAGVPLLQATGTPDFRIKDTEGKTRSLEDYRGKVLVLDFWATWCGPCQGELPEVKRLYETYHGQGVEFLGIALEEKGSRSLEDFREWCRSQGVAWPQIYSGKGWNHPLAKEFHIGAVPILVLIDRDGKVASEARAKWAEQWIRQELGLPPLAGE